MGYHVSTSLVFGVPLQGEVEEITHPDFEIFVTGDYASDNPPVVFFAGIKSSHQHIHDGYKQFTKSYICMEELEDPEEETIEALLQWVTDSGLTQVPGAWCGWYVVNFGG
jgi:hypothetical protein